MKRAVLLLLAIVITSLLLANSGTLLIKKTTDYEIWRIGLLLNGEVIKTPNTPVPFAFTGDKAQMTQEARTNFDLIFSPQLTLHNFEPFTTRGVLYNGVPLYLRYRYDELLPWVTFKFDSDVGDNLKAVINLDLHKDYRSYISHGPSGSATPTSNLPVEFFAGNIRAWEMSWPTFGYLSYAEENYYLYIGRNKLSWGPLQNGTTLSDASQYYDNLSGAFTTSLGEDGNFTYTFDLISVIAILNPAEWERQTMVSVTEDGRIIYWDPNQRRVYSEAAKHIIGHRFDVQLSPKFRFGFGEINVVGGKNLDITDFNPFIIYHNTYGEGFSNVMMSVDFSYAPFKGFQVYGEFTMDDFAGPTEIGARGKPTATAYGLGAEYACEIFEGVFSVAVEGYHTDTWIYNRWQPFLKITNRTYTKSELPGARDLSDYPLGFKYGPDVNALSVFMRYFYPSGLSITGEFDRFIQGEVTLNTPYLNMDEPSDDPGEFTDPEDWKGPVGETKTANILKLKAEYPYKSWVFGSDLSFYYGDYFGRFIYEVRPYFVKYF